MTLKRKKLRQKRKGLIGLLTPILKTVTISTLNLVLLNLSHNPES